MIRFVAIIILLTCTASAQPFGPDIEAQLKFIENLKDRAIHKKANPVKRIVPACSTSPCVSISSPKVNENVRN